MRELVGGIYFGQPRGFGTNEKGERIGYNTDVYSEPEVGAESLPGMRHLHSRMECTLCDVWRGAGGLSAQDVARVRGALWYLWAGDMRI